VTYKRAFQAGGLRDPIHKDIVHFPMGCHSPSELLDSTLCVCVCVWLQLVNCEHIGVPGLLLLQGTLQHSHPFYVPASHCCDMCGGRECVVLGVHFSCLLITVSLSA
jgi:hypothetical protein